MTNPTLLDLVKRVARAAGDTLMGYFERIESVEYKGFGDIVTEADRASENLLRAELEAAYPEIPFFGEEDRFADKPSDDPSRLCWIVDPLDGTTNYAAGIPLFGVSIALLRQGSPVLGVIYDPTRDDLFHAIRDEGAFRNGKPCRVSDRDPFDSIAPVAISADVIRERMPFLTLFHKTRSLGAASLHLCYLAAGVFDAAMDPYTKLWDVAAGSLILEEAGGTATHWDGRPLFPVASDDVGFRGDFVDYLVSNSRRHAEIVALTRTVVPERMALSSTNAP